MRFKERKVSIKEIWGIVGRLCKILVHLSILKAPFLMVKHYIWQTSPGKISLKNGLEINLSSHPHDLITFFGVFLRKDYGLIRPGSVVIDVGANIGIFALYAVKSGASKVYAFEPSKEAYEILISNIKINKLEKIIIPINKAVSDQDHLKILFPISSSPYNMIGNTLDPNQEFCEIETISISKFIELEKIEFVDLLKLDCEGAEFVILPSLKEKVLSLINDISLEYHGDPTPLVNFLFFNKIIF